MPSKFQTRMKIKTEVDSAIIQVDSRNNVTFLRNFERGSSLDYLLGSFNKSEKRIFLVVYRHINYFPGKIRIIIII